MQKGKVIVCDHCMCCLFNDTFPLAFHKQMLTEKGGDTVIDYLDQMGIKEVILPPPLTEKEKLMKSLGLGVGYDARGK